jgi:hypothetical protein
MSAIDWAFARSSARSKRATATTAETMPTAASHQPRHEQRRGGRDRSRLVEQDRRPERRGTRRNGGRDPHGRTAAQQHEVHGTDKEQTEAGTGGGKERGKVGG